MSFRAITPAQCRRFLLATLLPSFFLVTGPAQAQQPTATYKPYTLFDSETVAAITTPGFYACKKGRFPNLPIIRKDYERCLSSQKTEFLAIQEAIKRFNPENSNGCIGDNIWNCVASLSRSFTVASYAGFSPWGLKAPVEKDVEGVPVSDREIRVVSLFVRRPEETHGVKLNLVAKINSLSIRSVDIDFPDSILNTKTVPDFEKLSFHEYFIALLGNSCSASADEIYRWAYVNLLKDKRKPEELFVAGGDPSGRARSVSYQSSEPLCGVSGLYRESFSPIGTQNSSEILRSYNLYLSKFREP